MRAAAARPTSGWVQFGEGAAGQHRLLRGVGAIIENPAFYSYLSDRDNLRAIALGGGIGGG